ncbi:MAG: glycine cleavage system aminomethyltransferase GcvT [Magnetococcales bacterium]|nr:glycine cleavage system aminomethyltransferase GcvT [Magnetococcales bacterium]
MSQTLRRTPLYDKHVALGGRMVPFGGWEMPLHYGSQVKEHHAVRRACGIFDVSHMGRVEVMGEGAERFLRHLLANDVARLKDGLGQYTLMLNEQGGVIDDLIVYRLRDDHFRLVINAGRREQDRSWLRWRSEPFPVVLRDRDDLAMIALQGPQSLSEPLALVLDRLCSMPDIQAMPPFGVFDDPCAGVSVCRTGYTGEEGLEILLPVDRARDLWDRLIAGGVQPCGLGARDTLRLEAGLNLYGQEMDESSHPLESGVGWVVAWNPPERGFVGRDALETLRGRKDNRQRIGLMLLEAGVLRNHMPVFAEENGAPIGEITSGGYSPTLERGIALARVAGSAAPGQRLWVEVRGRRAAVLAVKPPFVKKGEILTPLPSGEA